MGAYDFNCANCGKTGAGRPTGGSTLAPSGWVWNKSFGFGRKAFCSNRCLDEYNSRNSSSESSSNSKQKSGGFISSIINDEEEERPKTEAEIAYEIERKRKQDAKRDEQERKAEARKEQKILKYQEEGKKFLLFTVEKPVLTFFLFFVLFPIIFFFVGAILFGGGKHMLFIPLIPMLVFAFLYLKESIKK